MPHGDPRRAPVVVHQFVPFLHPRDAVGNHTLATVDAIRDAGLETNLWVAHVEASLARRTRPYRRFRGQAPSDVLLYQASTGATEMTQFLMERPEPLVMYYHNVTPASFFEAYDDAAARSMREAREDIVHLARRAAIVLTASRFSARELAPLGVGDVRVMPPFIASGASLVPADAGYARSLRRTRRDLDLLFVGRIVPHKGHLNLLRTLAALRAGGVDARLFMVGGSGPEPFMKALLRLRRRLGLEEHAILTGSVSDAELAAHYEAADVFLSLSEHEGFGIPLLESMRVGLPVIAYDAAAVGEVLGGSGVLIRTLDPYLVAAIVARVASDRYLVEQLASGQLYRAQEIDATPRDRILVEAIRDAASGAAD